MLWNDRVTLFGSEAEILGNPNTLVWRQGGWLSDTGMSGKTAEDTEVPAISFIWTGDADGK